MQSIHEKILELHRVLVDFVDNLLGDAREEHLEDEAWNRDHEAEGGGIHRHRDTASEEFLSLGSRKTRIREGLKCFDQTKSYEKTQRVAMFAIC